MKVFIAEDDPKLVKLVSLQNAGDERTEIYETYEKEGQDEPALRKYKFDSAETDAMNICWSEFKILRDTLVVVVHSLMRSKKDPKGVEKLKKAILDCNAALLPVDRGLFKEPDLTVQTDAEKAIVSFASSLKLNQITATLLDGILRDVKRCCRMYLVKDKELLEKFRSQMCIIISIAA
jgi:hypothetical protein